MESKLTIGDNETQFTQLAQLEMKNIKIKQENQHLREKLEKAEQSLKNQAAEISLLKSSLKTSSNILSSPITSSSFVSDDVQQSTLRTTKPLSSAENNISTIEQSTSTTTTSIDGEIVNPMTDLLNNNSKLAANNRILCNQINHHNHTIQSLKHEIQLMKTIEKQQTELIQAKDDEIQALQHTLSATTLERKMESKAVGAMEKNVGEMKKQVIIV